MLLYTIYIIYYLYFYIKILKTSSNFDYDIYFLKIYLSFIIILINIIILSTYQLPFQQFLRIES